ncbi:MAG TPA: hypothetical protein VMT36_08495, partial [Candidatus Saccharimonadia bacterium]|nr:hypothetical protein [Candidatus Saccharimonadia bacterium]
MQDDTQTRLLDRRISRRTMLQVSAVAGASAFLVACGGGSSASEGASPSGGGVASPSGGTSPSEGATPGAAIGGTLNWANWPGYMDWNTDQTSAPTLTDFQARTGVEVNYVEDIDSNEDFLATIAPQLEAGLDTGWDLMVMTDYMAARLINRKWLEPIDPAKVPTAVANLVKRLQGAYWDPDQTYHYPYQTFADGVGYTRVSTGQDLTSTA